VYRLAWASDIHLNFCSAEVVERFCEEIAAQEPDGLVITGDIAESDSVGPFLYYLERMLRMDIYFVLGNHDFYYGSIAEVHRALADVRTSEHLRATYLTQSPTVQLTPSTILIGDDGFGDARLGDPWGSRSQLADWNYIEELKNLRRPARIARLQQLGDAAAERLLPKLVEACRSPAQHIVLATHVPPFAEAARYRNLPTEDYALPWYTCDAVGHVLRDVMALHEHKHMTVLCGHTHGKHYTRILPNLIVHTAGARYKMPDCAGVLELA